MCLGINSARHKRKQLFLFGVDLRQNWAQTEGAGRSERSPPNAHCYVGKMGAQETKMSKKPPDRTQASQGQQVILKPSDLQSHVTSLKARRPISLQRNPEKKTRTPVGYGAWGPSCQVASQPARPPAIQTAGRLARQPSHPPASQPTCPQASSPARPPSQPASQPASQPTSQPASQPAREQASKQASKPASQPASKQASQQASQQASE